MIQELLNFSWFVFLLSALIILVGSFTLLKTGRLTGLYYIYAGFIGLSVSGFLMTISYGIPWR